MFICYGHELVISRCPRLLTFFSCLILATKRNMGRGWKFSLLLLIVGMLCQCKYSLTQVCKHWTQEAVLSSFFYLVSHRNRGMSSLIYRWSAFYMNTMLWEGSIWCKTHSGAGWTITTWFIVSVQRPKGEMILFAAKNLLLKRGNVWCMVWKTKIIYCDPSYTEAAY